MPLTAPSDLFDQAVAVPMLQQMLVATGLPALTRPQPPDLLWMRLLAAEKDAARQLRVFFAPTEVFPPEPAQADIDALAGAPWVEDAGYDFDPEFFIGDSWGYLVTRYKPVRRVHSIVFKYPQPGQTIFAIPDPWIRLDKRFGHLRIVPTAHQFSMPLPVAIMQALGGGRTIPFMLHVRYTSGLDVADYPDLLDLVLRMAMYRMLTSQFPPTSGSISADGLSQSTSVSLKDYADEIERQLDTLRQAIHGPRFTVL